MKGDEQKAMRISPVSREDLVSGTSGTTSKKLMVGERERKSCNCIVFCSLPLGRHQSNTLGKGE